MPCVFPFEMLPTGSYLTLLDPAAVRCLDQKQVALLDQWPPNPSFDHLRVLCSFAQFVYEHKHVETMRPLAFKTFEPMRFQRGDRKDPHETCNCIWFPVIQYGMLFLEHIVEQALALLPTAKSGAARLSIRVRLQDALGVWTHLNEEVVPKWTDKAAAVFVLDCRKRLGEARAMCRWMAFVCQFADDKGKFPLPDNNGVHRQSSIWCSILECQRALNGKNQERVAQVVAQQSQHAIEMCLYHFAHEQAMDKEFGIALAAADYFKALTGKLIKHAAEWKHENDTKFKQPVPTHYPKAFDWEFVKKTVSTSDMFVKGKSLQVPIIWQIKMASIDQLPSRS